MEHTDIVFAVSILVPLACAALGRMFYTVEGDWKVLARIAAWLVIAYGAVFLFFAIQRLYYHG